MKGWRFWLAITAVALPAAAQQAVPLSVVRISDTVLEVGGECSPTLVCNVRFGRTTVSFDHAFQITLAAPSGFNGTALIWSTVTSVVIGMPAGATATCAGGCQAVALPANPDFPTGTIPLFRVNIAGGIWPQQATDIRAILSTDSVTTGVGLLGIPGTTTTEIKVDQTVVALRVSVPTRSTSACQPGTWALDENFLYMCVATNKWRSYSGRPF